MRRIRGGQILSRTQVPLLVCDSKEPPVGGNVMPVRHTERFGSTKQRNIRSTTFVHELGLDTDLWLLSLFRVDDANLHGVLEETPALLYFRPFPRSSTCCTADTGTYTSRHSHRHPNLNISSVPSQLHTSRYTLISHALEGFRTFPRVCLPPPTQRNAHPPPTPSHHSFLCGWD